MSSCCPEGPLPTRSPSPPAIWQGGSKTLLLRLLSWAVAPPKVAVGLCLSFLPRPLLRELAGPPSASTLPVCSWTLLGILQPIHGVLKARGARGHMSQYLGSVRSPKSTTVPFLYFFHLMSGSLWSFHLWNGAGISICLTGLGRGQ